MLLKICIVNSGRVVCALHMLLRQCVKEGYYKNDTHMIDDTIIESSSRTILTSPFLYALILMFLYFLKPV